MSKLQDLLDREKEVQKRFKRSVNALNKTIKEAEELIDEMIGEKKYIHDEQNCRCRDWVDGHVVECKFYKDR
jgi:hypothetical protein